MFLDIFHNLANQAEDKPGVYCHNRAHCKIVYYWNPNNCPHIKETYQRKMKEIFDYV